MSQRNENNVNTCLDLALLTYKIRNHNIFICLSIEAHSCALCFFFRFSTEKVTHMVRLLDLSVILCLLSLDAFFFCFTWNSTNFLFVLFWNVYLHFPLVVCNFFFSCLFFDDGYGGHLFLDCSLSNLYSNHLVQFFAYTSAQKTKSHFCRSLWFNMYQLLFISGYWRCLTPSFEFLMMFAAVFAYIFSRILFKNKWFNLPDFHL